MYILSDDTTNATDRTGVLAQVSGGCENHMPHYQFQPMPMPVVPPEQMPDMEPEHMTLADYIRQIQELANPYMEQISPLQTKPPM